MIGPVEVVVTDSDKPAIRIVFDLILKFGGIRVRHIGFEGVGLNLSSLRQSKDGSASDSVSRTLSFTRLKINELELSPLSNLGLFLHKLSGRKLGVHQNAEENLFGCVLGDSVANSDRGDGLLVSRLINRVLVEELVNQVVGVGLLFLEASKILFELCLL